VAERIAAEKGSPLSPRELEILEERRRAARAWLDAYAPERAKLAVRDALPETASSLDDAQRAFLAALRERMANAGWNGETLQAAIFEAAREMELPAGRAFTALYLAFLGQPDGPRAGWLLASLDRSFVIGRLAEAAGEEVRA
jgi:lysyl-tRNA synthetase class 1